MVEAVNAFECMNQDTGEAWTMVNGDSCAVLPQIPAQSVGLSIYSPPFANIFTYSDRPEDIGNCTDDDEFATHYRFVVREIARITKPGRLTAVHCSDLPTTKWRDGMIAVRDLSGLIRELHEEAGMHFIRRITIWRDPVVEMTRTKALNLLYKQLLKDSCKSWPGLPDYLLLFRAAGDNTEPVGHEPREFPLSRWREWASPVWMDIDQTNTLNGQMAREANDERHVCPLQLDLIERAVLMWSNPGDVVLSPFAGIGSEGFVAVRHKRRFVGVELKPSYWQIAVKHLREAEATRDTLFD